MSAEEESPGRSAAATTAVLLLPWLWRLAALAVSLPALVALYHIFWARLAYPLDLEWMESGVMIAARRAGLGAPLYSPPSVDYTSFCYPPLYPLLLGWLGRVFGLSYTLGRALSVLAFTASVALAFHAACLAAREAAPSLTLPDTPWAVRPRVEAVAFAAISMASVATAYGWTGAWYDLVRVDSLFLALAVGGLYALAAGHRTRRGVVLAGVLLGLAFFAKQTAVVVIVAAGLAQLYLRWRLLPVLVATVGAVAGLTTLAYDRLTGGWFWFYVYDLHQSHRTDLDVLWHKAPAHLWAHAHWLYLGCAAATAIWIFAAILRRRPGLHAPLWFLGALAGVVAAALGRSTQWAYDNAYIPGVVLPAVFCAVASAEARASLLAAALLETGGWRARALGRQWLLTPLCWAPAALVGVGVLAAGPPRAHRWVPSANRRAEAQKLLQQLHRLGRQGEVFVPYHPYYSVLAGGPGHGHIMSVNDVSWSRGDSGGGLMGGGAARRARVIEARRQLMRSIRTALGSGRFTTVIHDRNIIRAWVRRGQRAVLRANPGYSAQLPGLVSRYRPELDLAWLGAAPRTMSGNPAAPRFVWRLPRRAEPPPGGRVLFDFESPDHGPWRRQGAAFGKGPVDGPLWDFRRNRAQGLVAGAGGRRWVSSFHGGDIATGKLISPRFRLDRPWLQMLLGGGANARLLQVRLRVGGKVVLWATGKNSEQFHQVRWNVRRWQGRLAVLELVDEAVGSWGHIQLDEVWLVK